MKTRSILTSLIVVLAGLGLSLAADANLGTWKLNEAKSTLVAGTPKNTTVVYEAVGDMIKITVDGLDRDGKPAHNIWTGKFDGKDYAVKGDAGSDMRSYTRIDDDTLTLAVKKSGKLTYTGRVTVAPDGKSRIVAIDRTDPAGKTVTSTAFYDKQ